MWSGSSEHADGVQRTRHVRVASTSRTNRESATFPLSVTERAPKRRVPYENKMAFKTLFATKTLFDSNMFAARPRHLEGTLAACLLHDYTAFKLYSTR